VGKVRRLAGPEIAFEIVAGDGAHACEVRLGRREDVSRPEIARLDVCDDQVVVVVDGRWSC
jgi:hypothetical protein